MRYVLDASVALKWVLPEADSAKAVALRTAFQQGVHELLAPDILPVEMLHALTRAERRGIVSPGDGWILWQSIVPDLPVLHPHMPLLKRACEIASTWRHGIYDCLYIALAEREGGELVTADDKLVRNLQSTFPFILALSSFP